MTDSIIPKLRCTIFTDVKAQAARERDFGEWVVNGEVSRESKHLLPLVKMARFGDKRSPKGALRHDENVLAISGVELDYDEGIMDFQEAMSRLDAMGVLAMGYTSPSYTKATPKWRILLPFSQEYNGGTSQMKARSLGAVAVAESILDLNFPSESKKLSQSFFYGRSDEAEMYDWGIVGSDPVDSLYPDLAELGWQSQDGDDADSHGVDVSKKQEAIEAGENYHESNLSISSRWAALGMGREEMTIAMQGMMNNAADAGSARWQERYDDIPRLVETALSKFAPTPKTDDFAPEPGTEPTKAKKTKLGITALGGQIDITSEPEPMVWSVEKLLPQGELALFTGAPGTGKSFALLEIMMAAAHGSEVFGLLKARPHRVIYIGAEDHRDKVFHRRLAAWMQTNEHDPAVINSQVAYYHPPTDFDGNFLFTNKDGIDDHALKWLVKQCKDFGDPSLPLLVMIDPLMSFFGGESENSSSDMQQIVSFFRRFNAATGATSIICHHDAQGHDQSEDVGDKQGRGSSAGFAGVRSGFRLWKPKAKDVERITGQAVDEDEARHSYIALSQGKSNYGEMMRTIILRRGFGGILVPVDSMSPEMRDATNWTMYGEGVLMVLEDDDGVTPRDLERNLRKCVTRMCEPFGRLSGTLVLSMIEWAVHNTNQVRKEQVTRGVKFVLDGRGKK